MNARRSLFRRAFRALAASTMLASLATLLGCSVDSIDEKSRPAVANTCTTDRDCGSSGYCLNGACYSRSTTIDEVLLEITPDSNSALGGMSFLSVQSGIRRGGTMPRTTTLAGPVEFQVQVQVTGEEFDTTCPPYLPTGKQTIAARVQYTRTSSLAGVATTADSQRFTISVDTQQSQSGFSRTVSLLPGIYDVYVQPTVAADCTKIVPKLWRNVEIGRDGHVDLSAPPALLDLSTPHELRGSIERQGGSLSDWQVDVIDPFEGRLTSTVAKLFPTNDSNPSTNFVVQYQPYVDAGPVANGARANPGSLIRMTPPKGTAAEKAPTVYFDLAALDFNNTGRVSLNVSKLPETEQLVTVSGQVRGSTSGDGVQSTVKFVNLSANGLLTSFGPTVPTDDVGRYTTKLFPGDYAVVVTPAGIDGVIGSTTPRDWSTFTESRRRIEAQANQNIDFSVSPIRMLEGTATAGNFGVAQGATLEAAPLRDTLSGIIQNIVSFAPPRTITKVPVNDDNGSFRLPIDPGFYDIVLKPAAASNFAWWVYPEVNVLRPDDPDARKVNPVLPYPVRFEGSVVINAGDKSSQPLRNATIVAYARPTSQSAARQVGTARTDDMGRYYLPLPPGFASPSP